MSDTEYKQKLAPYRKIIDELDTSLIKIIAQRFHIVHEVGLLKKQYNVNIIDKEREDKHKANLAELAKKESLDPDFIIKIFELIIKKSVQEQQKLDN